MASAGLRLVSERCRGIWSDVARALGLRERIGRSGARFSNIFFLLVLYRCKKSGLPSLPKSVLARIAGRVLLGAGVESSLVYRYGYDRINKLVAAGLLEETGNGDIALTEQGEALVRIIELLLGQGQEEL